MKNLKPCRQLRVFHISKSPCAGAPGILSSAIDRYTAWESKIFVNRTSLPNGDFSYDYRDILIEPKEVQAAVEWADILHFHNEGPAGYSNIKVGNKPFVVQLHSEPKLRRNQLMQYRDHCITIAQKHAVLYKDVPYIPNLIPIYDPLYSPIEKSGNLNICRIVYSPTVKFDLNDYTDTCGGKGYGAMAKIIKRLNRKFGKRLDFKVMRGVPKEEVLKAKQLADIVVDECVTGGYHLSGLEGLSTGNIVFSYLIEPVIDIICEVTDCAPHGLPWSNCHIDDLEEALSGFIRMKLDDHILFKKRTELNTQWMHKYWRPEVLVQRLIDIYNKKLEVNDNPWEGLVLSSNLSRVRGVRNKIYSMYDEDREQKEKEINILPLENKLKLPALIMGNGPSLNKININALIKYDDPAVFSCNYFFKQFPDLHPAYWVCIDSTCLLDCVKHINSNIPIIINPPGRYYNINNRRIWISRMQEEFDKHFTFKFDLERPSTVATIMTLCAMYMGCSPIYIIGVDLSTKKTDNNYAYSEKVPVAYNSRFRDFSKSYYRIIREFKLIEAEAKSKGIEIYNLDPNPKNFKVFRSNHEYTSRFSI